MKNFQEIQLGVIGVLIFIIGIVLGTLFSGGKSEELMKMSKEKESLESRVTFQVSTIAKLNNEIEEAEMEIKKNQAVSKELSELEGFKPLGSEKTVKELYEEEQAKVQAEKEEQEKQDKLEAQKKEEAQCIFETDVCYKQYYAEKPFNTDAKALCSSNGYSLVNLNMLYKDFNSFIDYLIQNNNSWSVMATSTIKLGEKIQDGYVDSVLVENGKYPYGDLSIGQKSKNYRAYIYPAMTYDEQSLKDSTQWWSVYGDDQEDIISVLCYK